MLPLYVSLKMPSIGPNIISMEALLTPLSPLKRPIVWRLLKVFFSQKIQFSFMGNKILLPIPSQFTLQF